MKKIIVILIICLFVVGCGGNALRKSCKFLTKVNNEMPKVYEKINSIKERNPDFVDEDILIVLDELIPTLNTIIEATCKLDKVLRENEKDN